MITDGHNHTKHFSADAGQTIDELINEARSKGFTRVGITEHYEIDYPDYEGLNWMFDLDEYTRVFEQWREKAGELELLKGIEFGYQTHVAEEIDRVAASIPLDVVLLSAHLFRGEDFYMVRDCYKLPAKELHSEYLGIMAEMCEKCNNYDVVAHYDYINRYTDNKNDFVTYEECPKEFDRLFEIMIAKEKALEINTKSIQKHKDGGFTRSLPDAAVLKRYKDMGGNLITFGSDSHIPGSFAVCFNEAVEYVKSLGFNESVYFKNHKPYFEPL